MLHLVEMPRLKIPKLELDMTETRPSLPPFTRETAIQKVRGTEDGWNSCDPKRVSLVYTPDSYW
jgi:nuclear transport factor 2 (NTF2) superfamily protein